MISRTAHCPYQMVYVFCAGRDRDANGRQPLSSDGLRTGNGFAAKSKEAVRAAAQRWRQPFEQDSKHSKSHKCAACLAPWSLSGQQCLL